jgi:hypothetical protein
MRDLDSKHVREELTKLWKNAMKRSRHVIVIGRVCYTNTG